MSISFSRVLHYFLFLILLSTALFGRLYGQSSRAFLPADKTISLIVGGEEKHRHEVVLNAGEFFQVRVEQLGIDVMLRLLNATGVEVARMSLPRSYQNEIILTFVAPSAESYQLEVSATDAKAAPGKITIRREARQVASHHDRRRVAVEYLFAEGMTARDTAGQGQPGTAIQKFTKALEGWTELNDLRMAETTRLLIVQQRARATALEARSLLSKNTAESNREALKQFEEASKLYHEGGEFYKEAVALYGAGIAALNLKDHASVIRIFKQTFPLFSRPEDRLPRSELLMQIVKSSIVLGDDYTALEYLMLVLPVYKDLGLEQEMAITTMTIGAYYYRVGDYRKAFEFLKGAMPFRKNLGSKCIEVELLVNLAAASLALDQKADAVKLLTEEIPTLIGSEGGCELQKAGAWNNLGKAYFTLGDYGLAIKKYGEALAFNTDNSVKAEIYLNLGEVYFHSGRYKKALEAYVQASSFYKDASTRSKVDLEIVNTTQGQPPIQQLQNSLKLKQGIGDKSGIAKTLTRLGEVYLKLNNKQAALSASEQALRLYAALDDRSGEAVALGGAMKIWRSLSRRRLAIFFGKQGLNKIQELRSDARGIEVSLQKNYLRIFKDHYQQLAELLIEEGLFEQAVQVLNLFRDQQFFDFNVDSSTSAEQVYLSAGETSLAERYEAESNRLRRLETQISEVKRQLHSRPPDANKDNDLQRLENEFKTAEAAFALVLKATANVLKESAEYDEKDKSLKNVFSLRNSLATLGGIPKQRAASLYTLAAGETFYVLMMTSEGVKAFSHPTKARVLNDQVKDLLAVLSCPDFDPFKESATIYNVIFQSVSTKDRQTTLEAELVKLKPDLLLWSPGDPLDIVPMAALYDAAHKQFLIEKYQHAVLTRVHHDLISRQPKSWLKGIGFGAAREYTGYGPALRGVRNSLSIIFDDPLTGHEGIISGPALIDDQFKQSDLENLNGRWPLVHIASHFIYLAGDADNSALLLGDGTPFSLAEMQKHQTLFAGVELLALSACKTSVRKPDVYGKVIEGFAELSQRLGARSVIATLWNVYDLAAAERDVLFYRLYRDHQDWPKSEVLRQSQLNLLYGKVKLEPEHNHAAKLEGCIMRSARGRRFKIDPKAPLAHPYYWAPFVLYGSSR